MAVSDLQQVARFFDRKRVGYVPGLAIIFKSPVTGLLLSQLIYWHGTGKRRDGFIYKTIEEMRKETGLSRSSQETAIRELVARGYLEVRVMGIPAKRHFKLDLIKLINDLPSLKESSKLDYPNPPSSYVRNGQTITKITNDTTNENTVEPPKINKNNFYFEKQKLLYGKSM